MKKLTTTNFMFCAVTDPMVQKMWFSDHGNKDFSRFYPLCVSFMLKNFARKYNYITIIALLWIYRFNSLLSLPTPSGKQFTFQPRIPSPNYNFTIITQQYYKLYEAKHCNCKCRLAVPTCCFGNLWISDNYDMDILMIWYQPYSFHSSIALYHDCASSSMNTNIVTILHDL